MKVLILFLIGASAVWTMEPDLNTVMLAEAAGLSGGHLRGRPDAPVDCVSNPLLTLSGLRDSEGASSIAGERRPFKRGKEATRTVQMDCPDYSLDYVGGVRSNMNGATLASRQLHPRHSTFTGLYFPPFQDGYWEPVSTYPIACDTAFLYVDKVEYHGMRQWYLVRVHSHETGSRTFASWDTVNTLTLLAIYGRYMSWGAVDLMVATGLRDALLVARVFIPRAPGRLDWFISPFYFKTHWRLYVDLVRDGWIDISDFAQMGEDYGSHGRGLWNLSDLAMLGVNMGEQAFYKCEYSKPLLDVMFNSVPGYQKLMGY